MTHEDEAASRAVLAELRGPVSVPSFPDDCPDRAIALDHIAGLIRRAPADRRAFRARRWRQRVGVWAAAAAALVAVGGGWAAMSGSGVGDVARDTPDGATLVAGSLLTEHGEELSPGRPFAGGTVVRTPADQSALVLTPTGVQLTLTPATRATMPAATADQAFLLASGQLSLDVPPLPSGKSLRVVTRDAVVTVHGTRFSVAYDAGANAPTCVRVSEGRVMVARTGGGSEMLAAGEASGCVGAGDALAPQPPRKVAVSSPPPPARSASTLKQENDLLRQGLAAEQGGDLRAAEAELTRLIERYPESPFAPEARRALARVRGKMARP